MIDRRTFVVAGGLAPLVASAVPLRTIPYGLVFVDVELNGRTCDALVDTGSARALQVSDDAASALGLVVGPSAERTERYQRVSRPARTARVERVRVDTRELAATNVTVASGDIAAIGRQVGRAFDAIVGWPFLSATPFVIDHPRRELTFDDASRDGAVLAVRDDAGVPLVAGAVASVATDLLVDTGAPTSNVDPALAGDAPLGALVDLPFAIGGRTYTTAFRVKDLGPLVRTTGARAVVGHRFLRDFALAWDPRARTLTLAGAAA